jgi:hypothetical protein
MQIQIQELLKHFDYVNEEEQAEYGEEDLEEPGESVPKEVDSELLQKTVDRIK